MEILARAVGRRKEAVAQVQITRGTGKFIINNKAAQEYLQNNSCSLISIKAPFSCFGPENSFSKNSAIQDQAVLFEKNYENIDTLVKVKGGGLIGQAEAIQLAVARALCLIKESSDTNPNFSQLDVRKSMKTKGYLTQDSRVKERRKYGLKKARKASQYHKR